MRLIHDLVTWMAPPECLSCGQEGGLICASCLPDSLVTKRPTCFRCNRLSAGGRTCSSCRSSTVLTGVTVASHYDGVIKQLIGALKYRSDVSSVGIAARLVAPLLAADKFDLVTCVPTAAQRQRVRGYNQAELIAKATARELALPYSSLLIRFGSARQVGTSRQQRLHQLAGSLAARRGRRTSGRILIIDDALTTGATMSECAKVLKAAGAKSVWGAVVAKH